MLKLSTWIPNLTPDEHHRLKMRLNVILYSMLGLSVVLLQLRNPMNQATALIGIGLMSLSLILVRRDYLSFPRVAVPVVFWAVMTTFMANGSGLRDVAIYGYFIVIVMSGLLLGQDTIWAAMSLCILSVFGILAAEQSDLIHTAQHGNYDISEAIYISAYLLFSTILLRMVISSLNKSLAVARFNEQALGALNASLETRIQERTQQAETARQHSDRLFQAGRSINATNSHLELVNAIAAYINHPGYDVVISTYENFDKTGATYYTLLAGKIAGQQEAQMLGVNLPVLDGFTIALDELYSDSDVAAHPEDTRSVYLQAQGVVSAMAVGLYVGHRYLGNLSISTREKHHFSPEEGQLLLGLADLTAAAVDRIRLYDEQVKTAEELRALDMMKSQFLASMSHELRTPLNAILNFTEFMLVGMLGPTTDKQKDALQKTLGSGKHLLSLINDVLDMTKIQSGMMNLFIEDEVDLDKELHQVIATAESMLNGRPVRFIQEISPDLPKVVGDKRRIRQILLNLLSNAIKFTEEGSVTLRACPQGELLHFSIIDTGPGIAPEDHDLIFEPFRQTETGIQHTGGTGLGLPISRKLAEAHGGRLWLESTPGHGAAFHVSLPIRSTALLEMISLPE